MRAFLPSIKIDQLNHLILLGDLFNNGMTHFLNDPQHFHRYCECDAALLEEEFGSEELELVRGTLLSKHNIQKMCAGRHGLRGAELRVHV